MSEDCIPRILKCKNEYSETIMIQFSNLPIGMFFEIPNDAAGHSVYLKIEEYKELIDIDSREEQVYNVVNLNNYQVGYIHDFTIVFPCPDAVLDLRPNFKGLVNS